MRGEIHNVGGTNTILVAIYGNNVSYPMSAIIKNSNVATVYVGHVGVTVATGFPLITGDSLEVDMVNEALYAVATVTCTINVLRRGDA